jgi:hypothetical protein
VAASTGGGGAWWHNSVPRRMESVGGRRWPGRAPVVLWRRYEGEAPDSLEKSGRKGGAHQQNGVPSVGCVVGALWGVG